jgi:TRAP-type C4-dicarboxylate transport system permease small subunit
MMHAAPGGPPLHPHESHAPVGIAGSVHPPGAALSALYRLDRIVCWLGRASVVTSLSMVLIFSFAQVLDRYLLKTQFDAWDQLARIAMVWTAFLGAAMALRERRNIVIELIDAHLSPRLLKLRDRVFDILLLVLAVTLFIKSIPVVEVGMFQNIMGTPFTQAVSYAALTVSMALFILFLLLRVLLPNAPIPRDCFDRAASELP